jgi:hypothetical protein
MDQMIVAFWVFSGLIIAANISLRLWSMEPAVRKPYAILPPNLTDDVDNVVSEVAETSEAAAMSIARGAT